MPTQDTRDYTSISPSARGLLLIKGFTSIPYARQAATLIQYPEPYEPDFSIPLPGFWIRLLHIEMRHRSIDQMLTDLLPAGNPLQPGNAPPPTHALQSPAAPQPGEAPPLLNIIELSSGFSFRYLALAAGYPVNFIDTDLPDVIATKQRLSDALTTDVHSPLRGRYQLHPLNALDTAAFQAIIDSMPDGPIVIVNEGLLPFLFKEEKKQLCRFISKVLRERGGCWITADVYIRPHMPEDRELDTGDPLEDFAKQQKIYEKMFGNFAEATEFFAETGLVADKEAEPDYSILSSFPYFMACASPELLHRVSGGKITESNDPGKRDPFQNYYGLGTKWGNNYGEVLRATWRLRPA